MITTVVPPMRYKCAWCQKPTDDRYVIGKGRKKLNQQILPLCQNHRDVVMGGDALPLKEEGVQ